MDAERFDTIVHSLGGSSRRALVAGVVGGLLAAVPLAIGSENVAAKKNRRGGPRRRTWSFRATNMSSQNEQSGDTFGHGNAHIDIKRNKRGRYSVCGSFHYTTTNGRSATFNQVKDEVIQFESTTATPVVTFQLLLGLYGCQSISRQLAHQIIGNPELFFANIRTNGHPNGAVAGRLERVLT